MNPCAFAREGVFSSALRETGMDGKMDGGSRWLLGSSLAVCGQSAFTLATMREDTSDNTACASPPFAFLPSVPPFFVTSVFPTFIVFSLNTKIKKTPCFFSHILPLLSTILFTYASLSAFLPPSVTLRASARLLCFTYVDLQAYALIGYTP